jgi:hypothetical protein
MIRLTLNATSDPEIHLFNKSTILIGANSPHIDLSLPGSDIQPIHLKITEQNGVLIIINYANDPFVSLNGHPFGKKLLNSGDVILVNQTTILFENLDSHQTKELKEDNAIAQKPLTSLLEKKAKKQGKVEAEHQKSPLSEDPLIGSSFSLPFENEVEALKEEEWQQTSLETYLRELECDQITLKEIPSPDPEGPPERKQAQSLKDDYLQDLNDEDHPKTGGPFGHLPDPSHLYQAWKSILFFIFSLLVISGLIGTIIYFSVSDKTEVQETKATQGVADIAMALVHAHISHLKPPNHNWSDVDFLKSNLQAILPNIPSYASQIDAHGQFNCCPYSLRIYTGSDLAHFLLIAQPAPSLLQWLIPKSLIVVDSQLMELRTLKDVRGLNRLLANADPLEGNNGKEISALVKQGELIQLSNLANEARHSDFSPPKNLAWMRTGAENLIYNAPRYYRLGQSLAQKAINLSTEKGSSQEVAALKQAVENFSWLNHFVIYSEQGKKSAALIRQGLMMFAPTDKILFGYLLFNGQGKIHQVQILKDDEEGKEPLIANANKEKDGEITFTQSPSEIGNKDSVKNKNEETPAVDYNHPIYIQLQVLIAARKSELTPLATTLCTLINQDLEIPRAESQKELQNLSHSFLMADAKHKQHLKDTLDTLYHQYENMPARQFLAFVKELNLQQLIQQENPALALEEENCMQNMETMLVQIEKSKSLI